MISRIFHKIKDFFLMVFTKVGDIFEGCVIEWEPMKELAVKGIFEGMQAL